MKRTRFRWLAVVTTAALASGVLAASASAAAKVSPSSLSFAGVKVGTQSATQQVTVTGSQCPDLPGPMGSIMPGNCPEPLDIAVSGDFVIVTNTCPNALPGDLAAHTCTITVSSKPTALGPRSGFLRVQSIPAVSGVPLSGKGCKKQKTKSGKKKLVCKKKKK